MADLKLAPIESGTVIDHICARGSLHVLDNLGIGSNSDYSGIVSLLMNVHSKKLTRKDVIKIENRILTENEIYNVAVVAPYATINFIENYNVTKKVRIETLEEIAIACSNTDCKSNAADASRPAPTFKRTPKGTYVCKYCGFNSSAL